MKNVYLTSDFIVREIIPSEATPITEWYNEEFASHCIEAPDEVEQNWEYEPKNGSFYPPGKRPKQETIADQIKDILNSSI